MPQTAGPQLPNQFGQSVALGQLDQHLNFNTIEVQIDSSQSGTLLPGQAVKIVDSAGGTPKVLAVTAITQQVFGFINFTSRKTSYKAGDLCEISIKGNVLYLQSSAAIARGAEVCTNAAGTKVTPLVSTASIVGVAFDKATAADQLIRVMVEAPSFLFSA